MSSVERGAPGVSRARPRTPTHLSPRTMGKTAAAQRPRVRSTARLFASRSRVFVGVCYGLTVVLLLAVGWAAGLGWGFFVAMLLPMGVLGWQVARLDIYDPGLCLRLFKANREVGLAVGLALLAGRL